jgi:hypothetical protein
LYSNFISPPPFCPINLSTFEKKASKIFWERFFLASLGSQVRDRAHSKGREFR